MAMAMAITNGLCTLVKIRDAGVHGLLEWQKVELAVAERCERAEAIDNGCCRGESGLGVLDAEQLQRRG